MKPTTPQQRRFKVSADGDGVANHVGSAALRELADKLGLTRALSQQMSRRRVRRSGHDRGRVLADIAVTIADGGDCLSDIAVLRDQPDLFGHIASTPTAWRVVAGLTESDLSILREARRQMRMQAWGQGARPSLAILDFDATLVTAHSEKDAAAPTFKRGFGFHPLACFLDESNEALAAMLRPGNAGSNTVDDHIWVLEASLAQLPDGGRGMELLARADSGGATHGFLDALRKHSIRFSVGFDLTEPVRDAVLAMPKKAWKPLLGDDGEARKDAAVCELTGLDLTAWPTGTRAICRREQPHQGAQLTFTDADGYRFQVFITDQTDKDLRALEARHRGHARVEDRIRCAKQTGLTNFPFKSFVANQVWLELVLMANDLITFFQRLCLTGEARGWEPKRLRYRLLHVGARIVRTGRSWVLKLSRTWRWTPQLYAAFQRLRALPGV